ncbi:MAG: serine acetyltransferase [Bacteroidetes bacterium]|nr:serine acetyltransferase [Bacteroidota bacterium]
MTQSLSVEALCRYVSAQLNHFFPDEEKVMLSQPIMEEALQRLDFCFKHVTLKHYFDGKQSVFNHLFSDHYVVFLWFLSNTVYKKEGKCNLANKLYYLNKTLHGLDCMYDTQLPDIFLLFHSSGTMLGKASYADYFIALQGCTVGSQKGNYPVFGKGVSLTANSSVIGKCTIGNRCTISTRTTIFQKDMENDTTAFINFDTGQLQMKASKECYAQHFFSTDLSKIS